MTRRETGILGEKLAREYLEKHGYLIRETNYRCREGEIDIIAEKSETFVFVEVRTRKSLAFGTPEESISPAKMRKLRAASMTYLQSCQNMPQSWRIDAIVLELDRSGKPARLAHLVNAVGEE